MTDPQESAYDRIAAKWDAARTDFRPREKPLFDAFVQQLPGNAMVLDLGCGTGRPNADYLIRAGFAVHGVDESAKLVSYAQAHVPDATYELADIRSYVLPEGIHGVIAWDSLFHLKRSDQSAIFERLAQGLPPGAPFLFTSGGSEQDPFSDTMWGEAFEYDAHPPHLLPTELAQAGFTVVQSTMLEEPTGGRNKGRLAVLAERNSAGQKFGEP